MWDDGCRWHCDVPEYVDECDMCHLAEAISELQRGFMVAHYSSCTWADAHDRVWQENESLKAELAMARQERDDLRGRIAQALPGKE